MLLRHVREIQKVQIQRRCGGRTSSCAWLTPLLESVRVRLTCGPRQSCLKWGLHVLYMREPEGQSKYRTNYEQIIKSDYSSLLITVLLLPYPILCTQFPFLLLRPPSPPGRPAGPAWLQLRLAVRTCLEPLLHLLRRCSHRISRYLIVRQPTNHRHLAHPTPLTTTCAEHGSRSWFDASTPTHCALLTPPPALPPDVIQLLPTSPYLTCSPQPLPPAWPPSARAPP